MWLDLKNRETEEIRLSREELYDLVWSTPLSRLADDFVITDVALAKWCRKLNVPKPGVGYWAKVHAGQTPPKKKLPAAKAETPVAIRIRRKIKPPEAAEPEAEPAFERISVPENLDDPHPIVRRTRSLLRLAKVENGHLWSDDDEAAAVYVSRKLLPRALLVLDTLIRAAEAAGWEVKVTKADGTVILVDGTAVPLAIEEMRTWDAARNRYLAGGKLRIDLAHSSPMARGLRRTWKDGKVQRVEDVLHHVLQSVWRCAQCIRAWEARREQWRREDAEQARQWRLAQERKALEERRQRDLEPRLALWTRAQNISELVAAIRAAGEEVEQVAGGNGAEDEEGDSGGDPQPGLGERGEWVAWLEREASSCERRAMSVKPVPVPREDGYRGRC